MFLPPRQVSSKPRAPLAEKGQQMACMLATETFFRGEKSFSFRVSAKSLESPMKKDILRIIEYLSNRLRPGITEHFDLEHQMTDFLENQLLYPYEFPKTAFQIISNPNTYPHVLALLSYLIQEVRKSDEVKIAINAASLTPMFQAYAAWMAGRPDKEQKALGTLFQRDFADREWLQRELHTARASNAAIEAEIEELRNFTAKIGASADKAGRAKAEEATLLSSNDRRTETLREISERLTQLEGAKRDKKKNLEISREKTKNMVKASPELSRGKVAETRKQVEAKKAEIGHLAKLSEEKISDLRTLDRTLRETAGKVGVAVGEFNGKSSVGKIEFSGNGKSVEEMLRFPGGLLDSLAHKISAHESEISNLTRQIEGRKAEIARGAQAVQGAAAEEAELKRKLDKVKRETGEADRRNLETQLNTAELDFAKSVQKTKELEISTNKLDTEIRRNFQVLKEKLETREEELVRASTPVEELRLSQETEISVKLAGIGKIALTAERKFQKFQDAIDMHKQVGVVMPPLDIQWN